MKKNSQSFCKVGVGPLEGEGVGAPDDLPHSSVSHRLGSGVSDLHKTQSDLDQLDLVSVTSSLRMTLELKKSWSVSEEE